MDWPFFFELAINGALSGLMYSLVALGIVLIYKSSSVPNLAQGALAMLGAYVVLALFETMKLPIWAALAAGMVVMFGIGMGIERVALRRLAGRPLIMILMMTLALDIFVRASALVAWGGTNRVLPLPISADPLFIGPVLVNRSYVAGGVIALSLFGFFVLFFRTRMGIVLRAISDDYTASWSVGISVERGVALSWAMSAVVATLAGALWGSIQGVDQSLSLLLLMGITVAVLGGLDSIGGAILAGLLLGMFQSVASGYLDPIVGGGSRELVVAGTLVFTILVRPHGLFGREDIQRI
ncbi:branched-chain amino acid ABC transporter permease [Piscinibacter koreensis]|jgi:branched-chain amino acid transport system permease protein|uniref:Branched-chain amino acid ABC transporter permease n=1 Tax=Piscinibacter koreensis TaxID=2742824 RepID=A0A7Y6TZ27_9BURK|nr:branched-chain amino acid ABC transporter permease [Schlegelella koreensis]MBI5270854.1 branched-chain amino acid ABC transporter permease [Burkholderiales bacterium]NUZ08717.1 branched-chain amino acid ABC transporter permease [Schlegelella koreensis]HET9822887.1 branched-chain amino acid ABC transporter permease [Burkholderiaceae bacterium]